MLESPISYSPKFTYSCSIWYNTYGITNQTSLMRYYYFFIFLLRKIVPNLILLLFLTKQGYAYQDSSIVSIDARNIPIESVFKQIEKQTGVIFYYAASDLNGNEPVSLQLTKVKISTALDILLKGREVIWLHTNRGTGHYS